MTSFNTILEVSALEETRSTRENWDEERQNAKKECKSWREKNTKPRETPLKHNNLSTPQTSQTDDAALIQKAQKIPATLVKNIKKMKRN